MNFIATSIKDCYLIEPFLQEDHRGSFSCLWKWDDLKKYNLEYNFLQYNSSYNNKKGTIRGLHYQIAPYEEAKLIKCTKGTMFDVIIDMRHNSSSLYNIVTTTLDEKSPYLLYVPKGCAHGYQALEDQTTIIYHASQTYYAQYERGIAWNDPFFTINWPISTPILSTKDQSHNFFKPINNKRYEKKNNSNWE